MVRRSSWTGWLAALILVAATAATLLAAPAVSLQVRHEAPDRNYLWGNLTWTDRGGITWGAHEGSTDRPLVLTDAPSPVPWPHELEPYATNPHQPKGPPLPDEFLS